jgi:peptide-methionine (S)-S-oxide reductase
MKYFTSLPLLLLLLACDASSQSKSNRKNMQSNYENLPKNELTVPQGMDAIVIAGGCFWCTEAVYLQLKGVKSVESGYAGGHVVKPTYDAVCDKGTGHTEAIKIVFDPKEINLEDILNVFWNVHDPTTLNRQGNDVGPQYRSEIFYRTEKEKEIAEASLKKANEELWDGKIVTFVTPYSNFYVAEDYHQNYYNRNPNQGYCSFVITPKVKKFQKMFKEKLKGE